MSKTLTTIRIPAFVSLVIIIPFMIMEYVNTRNLSIFPIALFVMLWILALVFIVVLMQIVKKIRTHQLNVLTALTGIPVLILVAWAYVSIVIDQMPCFLGIPNCD